MGLSGNRVDGGGARLLQSIRGFDEWPARMGRPFFLHLVMLVALLRHGDGGPHPGVNATLIELGPNVGGGIGAEGAATGNHIARGERGAFRCFLRVAGCRVE